MSKVQQLLHWLNIKSDYYFLKSIMTLGSLKLDNVT
uniref:Uncharacterized protein n=1 Tax=Anguilla anguilla TaxID=7936 RepID=A0A0E9VL60_ANGAN